MLKVDNCSLTIARVVIFLLVTQHSSLTPVTPQQGGSSLDKFLLGKQQVAEDERKRLAMERMFESAKESKADRDTVVPDTGIIDDDEWDD